MMFYSKIYEKLMKYYKISVSRFLCKVKCHKKQMERKMLMKQKSSIQSTCEVSLRSETHNGREKKYMKLK